MVWRRGQGAPKSIRSTHVKLSDDGAVHGGIMTHHRSNYSRGRGLIRTTNQMELLEKKTKKFQVKITKGDSLLSSFDVEARTFLEARAQASRQKWVEDLRCGTINVKLVIQ